ncbi:hypothetical protein NP233_g12882 [Leucocoprinus birnbaumii]|uniref:Uncharacterized protein n=1 Tax=Leucocoprinus birnbaumii TaxID=56174 RepID=A0AAD5YPK3_9AGAR|nr:hypothetical protein NP233_g12882 [Leucocoprinus birnbaumii]
MPVKRPLVSVSSHRSQPGCPQLEFMPIDLHLDPVARPTVVIAAVAVTYTIVNGIFVILALRVRMGREEEDRSEETEELNGGAA